MRYVDTIQQTADMFTKAITKVDLWEHLLDLPGHDVGITLCGFSPAWQDFRDLIRQAGAASHVNLSLCHSFVTEDDSS